MPSACIRAGQVLVIFALLSVSGAHWLVLQSIAWTAMLVEYAHDSALVDAVIETFDGEHPCGLCTQIAQEKKAEKKTEVAVFVSKLTLFYEPATTGIFQSGASWELGTAGAVSESRTERPAIPPPRV
jgi:hypothetical protein